MKGAKPKETLIKKETKQTKEVAKAEEPSPTKVIEQPPQKIFKILVGFRDGSCQVLDYTTKTFEHTWEALHDHSIIQLGNIQQKYQFITGGFDSKIKIIDLNTKQTLRTIHDESESSIWCVDVHAAKGLVAGGNAKGFLVFSSSEAPETQYRIYSDDWLYSVKFHPHGRLLALLYWKNTLVFIDADKLSMVYSVHMSSRSPKENQLADIVFHPKGTIAIIAQSTFLKIINVTTKRTVFSKHVLGDEYINTLALEPKGNILAIGGSLGSLAIFNLQKRSKILKILNCGKMIHKVQFCPSSEWLVFCTEGQAIRIIETNTWKTLHNITNGLRSIPLSLAVYEKKAEEKIEKAEKNEKKK